MSNPNVEDAFPTEILVGGIVAVAIIVTVLGAVYLKKISMSSKPLGVLSVSRIVG